MYFQLEVDSNAVYQKIECGMMDTVNEYHIGDVAEGTFFAISLLASIL